MSPVNEKETTYEGCYGSKVAYSDLRIFLADAFQSNLDAEVEGSDERFAACIWGHSGCVLGDTIVRVRKKSDKGTHKINIVPSNP